MEADWPHCVLYTTRDCIILLLNTACCKQINQILSPPSFIKKLSGKNLTTKEPAHGSLYISPLCQRHYACVKEILTLGMCMTGRIIRVQL